eukprot:TRINITY_DN68527_c0_g1_i1.p1 TRINITY_DN68527_c0_g1~~TRINITY_DN68527_c0_g1_i1.p1  ORF type:complete len:523 (-),score=63.46 TRINITY_DN68527_c0_g1_i1:121-1689(-)
MARSQPRPPLLAFFCPLFWAPSSIFALALAISPTGTSAGKTNSSADTHHSMVLRRIAFGSCNKQYRPQPLWSAVAAFEPELWLWTGDAIYASTNPVLSGQAAVSEELLEEAYAIQLQHPGYRGAVLAGNTIIEGTFDDHDFGLNDAGKELPLREASQDRFLDFVGVAKDSPRRSRHGVFSSHSFGDDSAQRVKIILLDTRSHRDLHVVPSVGGWRVPLTGPLMALSATLTRLASALLGVGFEYEGDVLGDEQWQWLKAQLSPPSDAAAHILITSVQLLTTNPMWESWGHFPLARARLLRLLLEVRPRGLVVLSGDVHHAEISGQGPGDNGGVEVTSSGMTHTCRSYGPVCDLILALFAAHRRSPTDVFTGLNFGTIEFNWPSELSLPMPRVNGDVNGKSAGITSVNTGVADRHVNASSELRGLDTGHGAGGTFRVSVRDQHGVPVLSLRRTLSDVGDAAVYAALESAAIRGSFVRSPADAQAARWIFASSCFATFCAVFGAAVWARRAFKRKCRYRSVRHID